jgi:hypothetical protein
MNIKARIKKLFRRKPRGSSIADVVDVLESLERESRNIAEQIFVVSLVNPPRSREQIETAAGVMFMAIAQKAFGQMVEQGCDPDIAISASHSAAGVMQETFLLRYDELIAHGRAGTGGLN